MATTPQVNQIQNVVYVQDQNSNVNADVIAGATNRLAVDATVSSSVSTVTGTTQVQNTETTAALGGAATFTSTSRNCIDYPDFAFSVFLTGGGVGTTVNVILQHSRDNVTFRDVETIPVVVGIATDATLNRNYSVTRQYNRVRLFNTTANALAATELITMQKPIG